MKIEIRHRYNNSIILFSGEFGSLKLCVEAAVSSRANLSYANLSYANLSYANLARAYLADANLADAKCLEVATTEESDAMLAQIAEIVLAKPERLAMETWHGSGWDYTHTPEEERTCGTPHCMAGWAQALCPVPFIRRMDPQRAGRMLIPTAAHMFTASNAEALEFLQTKRRARPEATDEH